jgi:acetyltransferase
MITIFRQPHLMPPDAVFAGRDAADRVTIRPIAPDDEAMMVDFHRSLSAQSVYTRYFNVLKLSRRISHARLDRICHPDAAHETVLVAESRDAALSPRIAGVGRLSVLDGEHAVRPGSQRAGEVALIVRDADQHRGIGTGLLASLIDAAKQRGLHRLVAHMLPANRAMRGLCAKHGMQTSRASVDEVTAELFL